MSIELRIPNIGESITEVEIGNWLRREGDRVEKDDPLVELESDKATVELPSPAAGVLGKLLKKSGDKAAIDEVIAYLESPGAAAPATPEKAKPVPAGKTAPNSKLDAKPHRAATPSSASARETAAVAPPTLPARETVAVATPTTPARDTATVVPPTTPARETATVAPPTAPAPTSAPAPTVAPSLSREEEAVPMSPIRRRIAQRLVQATNTMALLTTINEIDLSAVNGLRAEYQEVFQTRYNVKLGLMSFFVKATIDALKRVPQLNAEIRGENIVYRNYFDIGIAISGGKGLVVPVLRDAERLSFAEIETAVADLAGRARENKIQLSELEGGTFTITNGGVFGSLLSTPIVNPPQSGVLAMHAIQDRPVACGGQVVIRPMMYVALTYDHRIVDGREAVTFLRRIKEVIEQPSRMMMEV